MRAVTLHKGCFQFRYHHRASLVFQHWLESFLYLSAVRLYWDQKSQTAFYFRFSFFPAEFNIFFPVLTTVTTQTPGIGYFLNLLDFMALLCSSSNPFIRHFLLVLLRATRSRFSTFVTTTRKLFAFLWKRLCENLRHLIALTILWGGLLCIIGFNGTVCKVPLFTRLCSRLQIASPLFVLLVHT